jgi:hypothetical protein
MKMASDDVINATFTFFPGWINLFQQPSYQSLLMRNVEEHTPASTRNSIWLLSLDEMQPLMDGFCAWMESLEKLYNGQSMEVDGREAAEKIFRYIAELSGVKE